MIHNSKFKTVPSLIYATKMIVLKNIRYKYANKANIDNLNLQLPTILEISYLNEFILNVESKK